MLMKGKTMINNIIRSDILSDLDHAQRLLQRVYNYAQETRNGNIERLMSVADSCIIDANEDLNKAYNMNLNGMAILTDSLVVEGIDRSDYPDFCDAYFDFARFADGTVLTDDQLDELTDEYRDVLHAMIFNQLF